MSKSIYSVLVSGIEFESNDLITFISDDFTIKKSIVRTNNSNESSDTILRVAGGLLADLLLGVRDEYTSMLNSNNNIQAKGMSFKESLVALVEVIRLDSVEKTKEKQLKINEYNLNIANLQKTLSNIKDQIVSYEKMRDTLINYITDYTEILEQYNNEDFKSED